MHRRGRRIVAAANVDLLVRDLQLVDVAPREHLRHSAAAQFGRAGVDDRHHARRIVGQHGLDAVIQQRVDLLAISDYQAFDTDRQQREYEHGQHCP